MFVEDKSKFAGFETKADPFTLEALIAWLRTRPSGEEYCFQGQLGLDGGCLFFRYGVSLGYSADFEGYLKTIAGFNGGEPTNYDPHFGAGYSLGCPLPHTMGAALARAEALLA